MASCWDQGSRVIAEGLQVASSSQIWNGHKIMNCIEYSILFIWNMGVRCHHSCPHRQTSTYIPSNAPPRKRDGSRHTKVGRVRHDMHDFVARRCHDGRAEGGGTTVSGVAIFLWWKGRKGKEGRMKPKRD